MFCKASISKTVPRVFLFFFLLFPLFFFLFFVFTPTEFTVAELCDDNAGSTGLITFSLARISCLMYNLSLVPVVLVFSSDIGTERVIIETTRKGGNSRYRRCRCRTLSYLPIFRLPTETSWVSATLRILIVLRRQQSLEFVGNSGVPPGNH